MQLYRWLPLLAFITLSLHVSAGPVLPLDETSQIMFGLPSGWILQIEPDGSGRLQFGQLATDGGEFPSGTFSFKKVYRTLETEGMSTGNMRDNMWISFQGHGTQSATQYWDDWRIARMWMSHAFSKTAFFDKTRASLLLKTHPFAPDQSKPE